MFSVRPDLAASSLAAVLALAATGCGADSDAEPAPAATVTVTATPSTNPSATPAKAPLTTAAAYAQAINKQVRSATKVTTLTEKTDSNNLLGRPNGYTSAAVISDKGGDTSDPDPGVAYGATVEMFGNESDAVRRSDYIQGLLKGSPILGTEYDYVHGNVLLRVSGELPPSLSRKYQAAFEAAAN